MEFWVINKMKRIILISNTFPFKGETFLETELNTVGKQYKIELWPFFVDKSKRRKINLPKNIELHLFNNGKKDYVIAFISALKIFLKEHEFKACLKKRSFVRNTIKGLKFAYISELRTISIDRWLKSYNDDQLIIYSYWMYESAYVAARIKNKYPKFVFITRCHGYDIYQERHKRGYLPFRGFIIKNADLIFPVSENGKHYLEGLYGENIRNKIRVARLGTIRKNEIFSNREKENTIVIVSCSNMVSVKRIDLIISALKASKKRIHWYHFGDGELRNILKQQARMLPQNIQYSFMGYQPNDIVQKFYADHYIDAFLNVSESEGIPVSIMEAESYGIPIIATNVGGTAEIVHDKKNGVLLKSNFMINELLDAIDEVIENADQYRDEALRTWQSMSNAHTVFSDFYKNLMEV